MAPEIIVRWGEQLVWGRISKKRAHQAETAGVDPQELAQIIEAYDHIEESNRRMVAGCDAMLRTLQVM